jgi:GxxExxY protein
MFSPATTLGAEISIVSTKRLRQIAQTIIDAAAKVHKSLGPGLSESAYEACTAFELAESGLFVEQQKPVAVVYRSLRLSGGCRLDLCVEREVIVEIKTVDQLLPVHRAQVLSYLRLCDCRLGLIINFNVMDLNDGVLHVFGDHADSFQA